MLRFPLVVLLCGLAVPCLAEDQPKEAEKSKAIKPAKKLEPAKCGSVKQLHVLDDIFLAGQPTVEDFQEFKKRGVNVVLNLRTKEELDFDEAAAIKKLDLKYHHLPIASADALTDETFEKARKLLNSKADRPILVHCASAGRVGAIWLAHRVLDDGLTYDAALAEAKLVGLKTPALEAKAKAYIVKQPKK